MTRARRAMCVGCHRPSLIVRQGRCLGCLRKLERQQNIKRRRIYDAEWRQISRRALAEHRARHGNWCPACGTHTTDLTVDHIKAQSLEEGVRVICRPCNASKGNR